MPVKPPINNLKDFFFELERILSEYYDKTYDLKESLYKIEDLKHEASKVGIEVNLADTILDNITPSDSYSSSYC